MQPTSTFNGHELGTHLLSFLAVVELTEEQKQQMLLSEGFRHFFDKSSRIVERALCDTDRIFQEYTGAETKPEP